MNLLIDIGNTLVKTSVFNDKQEMIFYKNFDKIHSKLEFDKLLSSLPITHALISATGQRSPQIEDLLKKHDIPFFFLNHTLKFPFKIDYRTPETLGADRIALAAGAILRKPKKNRLIIDAGTCITYDFVDKENIYRGGAISPGINMRLKSMHDYTANLPLVEQYQENQEIPLTGKDTIGCLKTGAIRGAANEIESFIVNYKLKHKDLTIFLTGGNQIILERYLKNEIFVNSKFLLFEGMNSILNMNK